ncbi:hypothetical protein ACFWAR_00145 [Streptomyces sp. NPDC059917]|uniref:hypothetical protein n=1 Tax=Streptomyces sp. NPDC059917 TaxID=3347002 RepID=UPI003646CFE8
MSGSVPRSPSPARPGRQAPGTSPTPLLSLRTAVVLLVAFVVGLVMGGLTLLSGVPVAGALFQGLASAGVAVPVLHHLIGQSR